ncbi:MAG: hypothetical protein OXF27_06725 [Acidobacteria bacterium]|nr:hypothetical protein [Acidobacteriota bacterium]
MSIIKRAAVIIFGCMATCVTAAPAAAQAGVVAGRVRATDGSALSGAIVTGESLRNSNRRVDDRTDDGGWFAFLGLVSGPWRFRIEKFGYEASEGIAVVSRTGRIDMEFVLNIDPLRPPVPATGVLAGIPAGEIQQELTAAHRMFDRGRFDDAIDAYEELLERVPQLTSLHLQIGHAYVERREYERALAAYQAVPADTAAATEAASAIDALQVAMASDR